MLVSSTARPIVSQIAKASPSIEKYPFSLERVARSLFKNGEQGVWFDPNDLTPDKINWRRNQFTYSEDFVGNWTPSRATFEFSTVPAPFGSSFATKLVEDSTTNYHGMYKGATFDVDTPYTFSIYLKAAERSKARLHWNASSDALSIEVDLSTGTIIRGAVSASITDVGGGWWRIAKTMQRSSGNALCVNILDANGVISYLGDGVSGIYVWGAQFEKGSIATEYQKITDFNSDFIRAFPNHTLYQDSVGTTPVTAAGQPVGLMLDKSKGLVLGDELFKDTSVVFSGGSSRVSPNVYRIYSANGTFSNLVQNPTTVVGKTYLVEYTVDSITTVGLGVVVDWVGGVIHTTVGRKRQILTATTTAFSIKRAGTACDIQVSDISVRELPGNHAYQSTAAARPMLRKNATTGANYLDLDGSDDFLLTNSIDFTATDKVSVFAGVRKLSDAAGTQIIAELSASSANNGTFNIAASTIGTAVYGLNSRGTASAGAVSPTNYPAPISNVLSGVANISGASAILRVNGAQVSQSSSSQGTGNFGNYPLYLFRRGGTTLPFYGHFYGAIIVGRLATYAEVRNIERLLATRVGVTTA